jgi:hypothetical protein
MQGFVDNQPLIVKVVWTDAEVPLLSGEALPYGLLAHTQLNGTGITRWLVPWSQIAYIKQDIALDQTPPEQPEQPEEPEGPEGVATGRGRRR